MKLETALGMEVERQEEREGEVKGERDLIELGATGFLTQEEYPRWTTNLDYHNGFTKLSRLEML